HLDDYFYPYPDGKRAFPDDDTYGAYTAAGGSLERDDWRRSNVDQLVSGLAAAIRGKRADAWFGISPFGIYRPGIPEGVRGLDQVATLHADPLAWYDQGWVDYLAPQLYWTTTHKAQRYDLLLDWWSTQVTDDRPLIVGLDATRAGKDPAWSIEELRRQVTLSRQAANTHGQIWFRATPVLADQGHVGQLVADLYQTPALPPRLARAADHAVEPPRVRVRRNGAVRVELTKRDDARAFVLYQDRGHGYEAERILGPDTRDLNLSAGRWALSVVDRTGAESEGAVVVTSTRDAPRSPDRW
ncbi:MAG: family 10 glycosylhydrolase, partial [Myxococcales bacterium]|nr:family 10 glycosylhydrolase [Myxococcales bacterium]